MVIRCGGITFDARAAMGPSLPTARSLFSANGACYRPCQYSTGTRFASIGRSILVYWRLSDRDGLARAGAVTGADTVAKTVRLAGVAAVYAYAPGGQRPERFAP